MKSILLLTFVLGILCIGGKEVNAIVYLNDGGHHTIDYTINDYVYVDYHTPGARTQLDVVFGGSINDLIAYENSQVAVSGGVIGNNLWTYNNSQVAVSGGVIGNSLSAVGNSRMTVSGGVIGYSLWAYNSSQVTISGGDIRYWLGALENSRMTVSGGKIGYGIYAGCPPQWDTSIITFEGTNFAVNGHPLGYGEFASDYAVPGTDPGGSSCLTGMLTGTLTDGGTLNKRFYIFDDADITFAIPEPATVLLLGLGAVMLRRKR